MEFTIVNSWLLVVMEKPEGETLLTFLDSVSEMDTIWTSVFLA